MKKLLVTLLAGFGLLLARPALAQLNPALAQLNPALMGAYASHHGCCHCCHPRDTTKLTELNNRVTWLFGPSLLVDGAGLVRGGFSNEVAVAVAPRLSVGGHWLLSFDRNSADNLGTEATAPATSLHALTGRVRYQLLNARRWRVEALAGLGLGAVQVVDRDQQVYNSNRGNSGTHAATVAFRVQPLAEVGLSTSWKLKRDFWLTSQATYAQPGSGSGLGPASNFSYWNVSVGTAIPWGYLGGRK